MNSPASLGSIFRVDYAHEVINHALEYVRENVHVNGMENFWSLFKRGINGTYVSVEPFHLFRCADEQAFRFKTRLDSEGDVIADGARFTMAIYQIAGAPVDLQDPDRREREQGQAEVG